MVSADASFLGKYFSKKLYMFYDFHDDFDKPTK